MKRQPWIDEANAIVTERNRLSSRTKPEFEIIPGLGDAIKDFKQLWAEVNRVQKLKEQYEERKAMLRELLKGLSRQQLSNEERVFISELYTFMEKVGYQTLEELPIYAQNRLEYMILLHQIDPYNPNKTIFVN